MVTNSSDAAMLDDVEDVEMHALDRAERAIPWQAKESRHSFRHDIASVNAGTRIHYLIGGEGPLIVLLHGFPQTWWEWRHVIPALANVGFTVLAPDLRGFGDSDKPVEGYDIASVAQDMSELVSRLGYQSAYVVGHDVGASTSYAWAAMRPDQVERAVLVEAIPAGLEDGAQAGPTWNGQQMWHSAFFQVPDLPEVLVHGREKELLTYLFRQHAHDQTTFSDSEINEYARPLAGLGGLRGALAHHRARPKSAEQNSGFAQRRLPMPVLTIGAEPSFNTRIAEAAERFADNVTGVVVGRSGHWVPEERPVCLTRHVVTFIG